MVQLIQVNSLTFRNKQLPILSRTDRSIHHMAWFIFLLSCTMWLSCATGKLYINGDNNAKDVGQTEKPIYTLYAIGDAGEQNDQAKEVLHALVDITADDSQPGMIIFLGDNIYPAGLAAETDIESRQYGEEVLTSQVNALSSYRGDIVFVPGNHDWNEFKPGGLDAIKREGDFIKSFKKSNVSLLPQDGCGGPFVKELNQDAVLLILDSQWWIQDWDKEPKMNEGCAIKSREEMIKRLHELFEKYKDRQILIAMHHPLESRGPHGGYFSFQDHVFPLTKLVDWLYLPLPVIGSIYPWYRQVVGHPQDENGKMYREMKESILEIALQQKIIFLSGHDHNLQYVKHEGHDILVSGSGAKQNAIANGEDLIYGHKAGGFMALDFYKNGSIEMSAYEVEKGSNTPELVFRQWLRN